MQAPCAVTAVGRHFRQAQSLVFISRRGSANELYYMYIHIMYTRRRSLARGASECGRCFARLSLVCLTLFGAFLLAL